jgi:hypothetical protein
MGQEQLGAGQTQRAGAAEDRDARPRVFSADPLPMIRVRTPDAEAVSLPSGMGERAPIPFPVKAARASRGLSPLWSEVAWVLAQARLPVSPERHAHKTDRLAA